MPNSKFWKFILNNVIIICFTTFHYILAFAIEFSYQKCSSAVVILQESGAIDIESVRSYMLQYLADGSRSYSEPYFTVSEVNDY